MVNSLVGRATSDMLIGPDWARNIEICDILNHDPGQAKDVVKGIKKRIGSKNPKVQLLALTVLETIVKNCGDIVHMHVAERDIPHDMAKIVKKKPNIHVKEKILTLIDIWQEAFGGPRARYPQYYAAYQELLQAGAVFPQRPENSGLVFTPLQTQPLSSYPQNVRNSKLRPEASETSSEAEYPTLSLTEIQNARGIMDVLSEMLNAIDPANKEGIQQDVVIDLVEQCRTYKQRVVHLVNSTSDEPLLRQGIALNDELQHLLAKHEAIASGTSGLMGKTKDDPASTSTNKDADGLLVDVGDSGSQPDGRSPSGELMSSQPLNQLLLPAQPSTGGPPSSAKMDLKVDLLSGEDFSSPKVEPSLALVPVGGTQVTTAQPQQNALVLFDMFSDGNIQLNPINTQNGHPTGQTNPSTPQFQQQPSLQPPQFGVYANGNSPTAGFNQPDQSFYAQGSGTGWNSLIAQPQQSSSPVYGAQTGGSLPPPPWEAPALESSQGPENPYAQPGQLPQSSYTTGNEQNTSMYMPQVAGSHLPGTNGHQYGQPNQMMGIAPQPMHGAGSFMGTMMAPQQMQAGPPGYMYAQQMYGGQMAAGAYGYSPQGLQFVDQRMYGLSVRDDGAANNYTSSQSAAVPSYTPPMKPSKPEDKLFGDLVDMARVKKSGQDRAGII